jgi:chemotaxis protein MotA
MAQPATGAAAQSRVKQQATIRKRHRGGLDLATLLGIAGAFALVVAAMVLGGSPSSFFDLPAILIVLGGTAAVTTVSFSFAEMASAMRTALKTFLTTGADPREAARQALLIAEHARKYGVLALEDIAHSVIDEPVLHKGLTLAIDGAPGDDIEKTVQMHLEATRERHLKGASVLRRAGEVSPAMGLIGTLVGLVQMLGSLDDPSSIGPAMAVALLTTFYGAILATMVFLPLASKLERNSKEELLNNHIFLMAITSIGRRENPRRLEGMINTILPPDKRVKYFS